MKPSGCCRLLLCLLVAGGLTACESKKSDSSSEGDPPAEGQTISKRDLLGQWRSATERQGSENVTYIFTLKADDKADYEVSRIGTHVGTTSLQPGSWDLAGTTLILDSPSPEMNGSGDVVGLRQVTINGRAYNKQ